MNYPYQQFWLDFNEWYPPSTGASRPAPRTYDELRKTHLGYFKHQLPENPKEAEDRCDAFCKIILLLREKKMWLEGKLVEPVPAPLLATAYDLVVSNHNPQPIVEQIEEAARRNGWRGQETTQ